MFKRRRKPQSVWLIRQGRIYKHVYTWKDDLVEGVLNTVAFLVILAFAVICYLGKYHS